MDPEVEVLIFLGWDCGSLRLLTNPPCTMRNAGNPGI